MKQKPLLTTLIVPGENYAPDNDIQSNDTVIIIPNIFLERAIQISNSDIDTEFFLFYDNRWGLTNDEADLPISIVPEDSKYVIRLKGGKIISHSEFVTI